MENVNKIISFILGLIVVIVLIALAMGRLNFKNPFAGNKIADATKTTITPGAEDAGDNGTNADGEVGEVEASESGNGQEGQDGEGSVGGATAGGNGGNGDGNNGKEGSNGDSTMDGVNTIPNSGAPAFVIPMALLSFAVGMRMRKAHLS